MKGHSAGGNVGRLDRANSSMKKATRSQTEHVRAARRAAKRAREMPGGATEAECGEAEWELRAEEAVTNRLYIQIEPLADSPDGPLRGPRPRCGPLRGAAWVTPSEGPPNGGRGGSSSKGKKRKGQQARVTKEPKYGEIRRQIKRRKTAKTMKDYFGKVPFRDTG